MREDYTHITLVVDRSGSMTSVRDDAEKGINSLLEEQFALDGKLTVTLVEFDDSVNTVTRLAKDNFTYNLKPRGFTALLDAVGREITKTGEDLAKMKEKDRPAKVLFVVVTDGHENASSEYTVDSVKTLTDRQKSKYNWDFQFIGADQAAWAGHSLGMNTTQYVNNAAGNTRLYATLNNSATAYRSATIGTAFAMADVVTDTVDSSV